MCFQDYFRRFHDRIPERASRDMMRVQCRDVFVVRNPEAAIYYYLVQPTSSFNVKLKLSIVSRCAPSPAPGRGPHDVEGPGGPGCRTMIIIPGRRVPVLLLKSKFV